MSSASNLSNENELNWEMTDKTADYIFNVKINRGLTAEKI